ncbi:hypothetical protein PR202_gb27114 [Eleusine coracana subsp. coracana]|uniref:Transmembrane protein n=1 Tax=Eleusine coracana subsp. coracana TaxID=191504 RepID=A0AAV5FSW5_ELECO|nr:hypothetical protein PR202_gb27114 [Eleusine coracana subsp. coracana]
MCCCDCECRPLGWLLGLPFAVLALLVSLVGAIIWIIGWVLLISLPSIVVVASVSLICSRIMSPGLTTSICRLPISCICPCCLCVTVLLEVAVELVKAPLHVMTWFTSKIPC